MKVVIAEKPSVASELAHVLKASSKKDGYFEGNGYIVTWAIGHIVQLAEPKAYDDKYASWSLANLPILPETFKYVVDVAKKNQLSVIKTLFTSASEIIVATDAGREGELIFRYIYYFTRVTVPFKRLWISDMTEKSILNGFANLKDGKLYDNLYLSAKCRSESDWLIGMNGTQALTCKSGSRDVLSLGRVQTPTLAIICKRFLANKNFVPKPYFALVLTHSKNGISFKSNYQTTFDKIEAGNAILSVLQKTSTVSKIETKDVIEKPPRLFSITTLQQEANKKFGFSAKQTLDIAQKLYETYKLSSYPRTEAEYLANNMYSDTDSIFSTLNDLPGLGSIVSELRSEPFSKSPFDDSKVTDHHAIIPTTTKIKSIVNLPSDCEQIYYLIVKRYLAAFHKPCLKKNTTIDFLNANHLFSSKGTVISFLGWRSVEEEIKEETNEVEEENQKLPAFDLNENVQVLSSDLLKKFTSPLPLFTESSLLQVMKSPESLLDNKELKESIKGKGLGTGATRASIIETLFSREYLLREKKKLVPTGKGLSVFKLVEDKKIASVDMTGEWEEKLELIAEGKYNAKVFISEIKEYASELTKEIISEENIKIDDDRITCPKCGKGKIFEGPKSYSCTEYKTGCDFGIWKEIASKKITASNVKDLLTKKKTGLIKGFMSKAEKPFEAYLIMSTDFKISFEFSKK